MMKDLINLIEKKEAVIAVIGLGYVGLPLAVEKGKAGFKVIGIDCQESRVAEVNRGENYIPDVVAEELDELVRTGMLKATTDFRVLREVDCICICVPTPLGKMHEPDMQYILSVSKEIAKNLQRGQLIVLESTTYPGTTEEVILPLLSQTGLSLGKDFFLAFSPERVDPGNKVYNTKNTPKVVGGVTEACTEVARTLYSQVIEGVFPVSSPRVAEMEKLLENIFRSVNIALVNEMALLCDRMDINIWEVVDAAKTKPYGFMPFYPGPGLGGHCIPIDPFYLSWKAREFDFQTKFIELSGEINRGMPNFVIAKASRLLNKQKKCLNGSKILVLGIAYKSNIDDLRESPALKVIELLAKEGVSLEFNDPFIPHLNKKYIDLSDDFIESGQLKLDSVEITEEKIKEADCVLVATDHSHYDWEKIVSNAQLVFDTRNATKRLGKRDNLFKL